VTGTARSEGRWVRAAGAVVIAALGLHLYNAAALPPLRDHDGAGHLLNVWFLAQGQLPPPGTWSGFHPPLYHAWGALLWLGVPDAIPGHLALRWLSWAAVATTLVLVWRGLRRFAGPADAAVATSVLAGAPVVGFAASTLGNETLCALFVTSALIRLGGLPLDPARAPRHAAATSALLALAVLSKSTGWLALGVAGLTYLIRYRHLPRTALLCGALAGALPLLVAGPFYARVAMAGTGTPSSFLSGAALSPDLSLVMSRQPPGERHLSDYLYVPRATFTFPHFRGAGLVRSVPGLLHASIWADPHGQFLQLGTRVLRASSLLSIAGVLPMLLIAGGAVRLIRRRRLDALPALGFGVLLLLSLLRYSWMLPQFSAVKAHYLLPSLFACGLALAGGLAGLPDRLAGPVRAILLALALAGSVLSTWGWWLW
jgi:hypothetical protein